jgi:hypothetical protein
VTSRRALPAQRLPRTRRLPAQPVAMLFAWNFSRNAHEPRGHSSWQQFGILHGPEEQSRPRGGTCIGVTDQPQYPRL